jgi:FkbM family methyltransferase
MRQHNHGSWSDAQEFYQHECRMITVDEIAANLSRLDFIKCDVEGAELLVLQGSRSTLDRLSPILSLKFSTSGRSLSTTRQLILFASFMILVILQFS